jgi:hypothetical protein
MHYNHRVSKYLYFYIFFIRLTFSLQPTALFHWQGLTADELADAVADDCLLQWASAQTEPSNARAGIEQVTLVDAAANDCLLQWASVQTEPSNAKVGEEHAPVPVL